ncbi:hypothetical protein BASA62_000290 [Batrachochytrium salamandrivorans]|nr:hypothetical protein BASA62_000290 [Batrachochytrium salamandrivorans]
MKHPNDKMPLTTSTSAIKRAHSAIDQNDPVGEGMRRSSKSLLPQSLVDWGHAQGANVANINIRETANDDSRNLTRGAYAANDIEANSEICFIPNSMLLSESDVRASKVGQAVLSYLESHKEEQKLVADEMKHPQAGMMLAMAAFMVYEISATAGLSRWMPYLVSLPKEYTMPIAWKKDRILNLLGGTSLQHMMTERQKWLEDGARMVQRACASMFPDGALSKQSMLWAMCSIWSRAFPRAKVSINSVSCSEIPTEDWISLSEICLFPILDMLNHKRGRKIQWRMSNEGVTFLTLEPIVKGQELLNNYGPKGNENLFSNYGFVIENNPEDYFKVFLALRDNLPVDMIAVCRILVANEWDLALFATRALNACDSSPPVHSTTICVRNELLALSTLYSLFLSKLVTLKRESPDFDQDIALYPEDEESRRLTQIYRAGQTSVLEHALKISRSMLPQCNLDLPCHTKLRVFVDDYTIHATNPHLDPRILSFIAAVMPAKCATNEDSAPEVDPEFDPDALLTLLLVNELKLGKDSYWEHHFTALMADHLKRQEHLGEIVEDMEAHFDEWVGPQLRALGKRLGGEVENTAKLLDDKDMFVCAACAVECHGVTLSAQWVNGQDYELDSCVITDTITAIVVTL